MSRDHQDGAGKLWLALSKYHGLGPALIKRLVDSLGSPDRIFSAGPSRLEEVPGIGKALARSLSDNSVRKQMIGLAETELQVLRQHRFTLLCPDDDLYPELLKNIYDPPACLYCHGDVTCLQRPSLAVIGSRSATSYGRQVSFQLGRDLARRGMTVVSGMAFGIDSESHRGALAGEGKTVAVLGCGLDVVYPPQNRQLYRDVANGGVLLSEYPPGTRPDGFRFPARNRIISGLALGVIVVEAAMKSGSLITAKIALEQGREVFAVPGRIDSVKSAGTHKLLREGAHLVHGADDIVEELGLAMSIHGFPGLSDHNDPGEAVVLAENEKQLLSYLDVYPVSIDEIVQASGMNPGEVHGLLLGLEFKGLVRQVPGQQYGLTDRVRSDRC